MFAGHLGAALALSRADRRGNVGTLIGASLLLDVVLWCGVLGGWESVVIPAGFAQRHVLHFTFPYSHGLASSVGWALLAALAAYGCSPRPRAMRRRFVGLVGVAIWSHWMLDALGAWPGVAVARCAVAHGGVGIMAASTARSHRGSAMRYRRALAVFAGGTAVAGQARCAGCFGAGGAWLHRRRDDGGPGTSLGDRLGDEFTAHRRCGICPRVVAGPQAQCASHLVVSPQDLTARTARACPAK